MRRKPRSSMVSMRSSSSSAFQPRCAEMTTLSAARASGRVRSSSSAESASRSALFMIISFGRSPTPRSASTPWTMSARSVARSDETSTTCSNKSAASSSSSVARNAATRSVAFELGLTGAAADADAADLALEVGPGAGQPGQQILEPREMDLDAPLVRPRTLAEDVQDEQGAIDHTHAQDLFHRFLGAGWQL